MLKIRLAGFGVGILALSGCNSAPDPTLPAPTPAIATVAPTVVPTSAVPAFATTPTAPPLPTPSPITADSLAISPTPMPILDAEAQRARDASRLSRVGELRREISEMERQKASAQARKDSAERARLERDGKSGFSAGRSDVEIYAEMEISSLNGNIAGKQREIDRVMMSR